MTSDSLSESGVRQVPVRSAPDFLRIQFNDPEFNEQFNFPSNTITTSKYTYINFLPINLLEQFRRLANSYFLLITILCFIEEIAPFSPITSIVPLVLILTCTGVKDWIEDRKRHKQDNHHNSIPVDRILKNGMVEVMTSGELRVGDIIRIKQDQEIPADCVVLKGPPKGDGTCRMNTSSLDGENAPKVRKALGRTQEMSLVELASLDARIECKPNDKELRGFSGRLIMDEWPNIPVNDEHFLFRAAFLANTLYVYAIVMFVGSDTTLMLNRSGTPWKFSTFERNLNYCVAFLLFTNLVLCILLAIFAAGTFVYPEPFPMLMAEDNVYQFWLDLGTWYILFSFMVPISLYVTVELVKIFEGLFMQHDLDCSVWEIPYDLSPGKEVMTLAEKSGHLGKQLSEAAIDGSQESNVVILEKALRKGMQVRASALNEELGQVQYIFTDKTGTLTQNKMELSKLSVDGVKLLHDLGTAGEVNMGSDFSYLSEAITEMCTLTKTDGLPDTPMYHLAVNLLVCSETLITRHGISLRYLSPSPDEVAFAEALDVVGVHLIERDAQNNVIIEYQGDQYVYETLAVLQFQSHRLRMTVVSRDPEGRVYAYSKGADTIMLPDMNKGGGIIGHDQAELIDITREHMYEYACAGSRILVAGYRQLSQEEFREFWKVYEVAANEIEDREELIEEAFKPIETNMRLIGCTAVEDQIQDGVLEVVNDFKRASIKVMMLTGDKRETAVTIGNLSGIISGEKPVYIEPPSETKRTLDQQYADVLEELRAANGRSSLVINGKMLEESIKNFEGEFKEVFDRVDSIICNRAAPAQKAHVVRWAMKTYSGVCLAIGDGANDVAMIQASNVGIGIMGKEGTQAALASDFIIYRFAFLKKLLFVHGHYNYLRTSKVVLICIYKNLACILPLCWYGMYSNATGQSFFEAMMISMFNIFFTSLPPFTCGLLEKDAPQDSLMNYPEAYHDFSQIHPPFSLSIFIGWCVDAIFQSLLYFFYCYCIVLTNKNVWSRDGKTAGLFGFGTMLYTYEIVGINLKMLSVCQFWNVFTLWSPIIGIVAYFALWFVYEQVCWYTWDGCYVFSWVVSKPFFWLALIPFIIISLLPGVIQEAIRKHRNPNLSDILAEAFHFNYHEDSEGRLHPLKEVCKQYQKVKF